MESLRPPRGPTSIQPRAPSDGRPGRIAPAQGQAPPRAAVCRLATDPAAGARGHFPERFASAVAGSVVGSRMRTPSLRQEPCPPPRGRRSAADAPRAGVCPAPRRQCAPCDGHRPLQGRHPPHGRPLGRMRGRPSGRLVWARADPSAAAELRRPPGCARGRGQSGARNAAPSCARDYAPDRVQCRGPYGSPAPGPGRQVRPPGCVTRRGRLCRPLGIAPPGGSPHPGVCSAPLGTRNGPGSGRPNGRRARAHAGWQARPGTGAGAARDNRPPSR